MKNSLVDEFLEYAKQGLGNSYYMSYGIEWIDKRITVDQFRMFCKELELLRGMAKVADQYCEYIKQKNQV